MSMRVEIGCRGPYMVHVFPTTTLSFWVRAHLISLKSNSLTCVWAWSIKTQFDLILWVPLGLTFGWLPYIRTWVINLPTFDLLVNQFDKTGA